jgi:hypothetical protein
MAEIELWVFSASNPHDGGEEKGLHKCAVVANGDLKNYY